mmetsp:Transcript_8042/g.20324  ORF Transcript_8042/g.20324 Transcript_8042/m.20324 type:complete len:200 (-) Transcript_8042:325-924(-)|eukprot:CAMPEP_0197577896 /NCGR_PEP_ID=MMETSP1326-20131121/2342_1 /TAXON_ID=1155430 /ORGANISM="Genus nov. species nov., Strain RCC2288" /LENGTH=199 /DNA_ID=CAMNT_0043141019 /DNA_START=140 /DNA_END=739 /DNA_ORIENTATION=-
MVKVTNTEQALKGVISIAQTAPKKKTKTPAFYPADNVKFPLKKPNTSKPTKLRPTVTPGTVLILLAGHFKGKRVVFLKQLASGLLLVCGPYGVNGVPIKRVNQCYIIATSQKVDVSKVVTTKFDDAYFKKPSKDRSKKSEEDFFQGEVAKKELPASYIEHNKALDASLGPAIEKVPYLKGYLATHFTLRSGDKPHEMKF